MDRETLPQMLRRRAGDCVCNEHTMMRGAADAIDAETARADRAEQALGAEREYQRECMAAETARTADAIARADREATARQEAERERDKFQAALSNHLCPYDMADWVHCAGGHAHDNCRVCDEADRGITRHDLEAERDTLRAELAALRG